MKQRVILIRKFSKTIVHLIVLMFLALGITNCNSTDNISGQKVLSQEMTQSNQPAKVDNSPKVDNKGNYDSMETVSQANLIPPATNAISELPYLSTWLTATTDSNKSISTSFFTEGPGYYSVQVKDGDSWRTFKENVHYIGAGGIAAGDLMENQNSKTLRLLKIDGGHYSAIGKEITVVRSEVISAGGIKTYEG